MKLPNITIHVAIAASMALASFSGSAAAQQPFPHTRTPDRAQSAAPNRKLFASGVWTLGISYVPAVIVGAKSPLAADKNLLIPVAGPWMDYAARECRDCTHETMNRVMLLTDGIVQGIGALQILGSLLFIEPPGMPPTAASKDRRTASKSKGKIKLTPTRFSTGSYGLTARTSF